MDVHFPAFFGRKEHCFFSNPTHPGHPGHPGRRVATAAPWAIRSETDQ